MPQIPCPLVQPLPVTVPYPTSRPATTVIHPISPTTGSGVDPVSSRYIGIASNKPHRKLTDTGADPRSISGGNSLDVSPLMPAIRPTVAINITVAMPISPPPASAEIGVNSVGIAIVLWSWRLRVYADQTVFTIYFVEVLCYLSAISIACERPTFPPALR